MHGKRTRTGKCLTGFASGRGHRSCPKDEGGDSDRARISCPESVTQVHEVRSLMMALAVVYVHVIAWMKPHRMYAEITYACA